MPFLLKFYFRNALSPTKKPVEFRAEVTETQVKGNKLSVVEMEFDDEVEDDEDLNALAVSADMQSQDQDKQSLL